MSAAIRLVIGVTIVMMAIVRFAHRHGTGEGWRGLARYPGARRSIILPVVAGAPWGALTIGWLLGVVQSSHAPGAAASPAAIIGAALCVASAILYVWVHQVLGRNFSIALRVLDDHALITDGPYSRVRHPMYTAGIGLMFGVSLASWNVWITAAAILFTIVLVYRTRAEEALLVASFGEAYEAYRGRTGSILPRIF